MVLNTRKGDLRGLSPDPAPRGPQAPPRSRPPADAGPRLLPRSSGGPGGTRAAAGVPQSRGTQSPGASVLGAKAQGGRRLLPERSSGGPRRRRVQTDAPGFQVGFGRVEGALGMARVLLTQHRPAHSKASTRKALGPRTVKFCRRRSPEWNWTWVPGPRCWAGSGGRSAAAAVRTTTQTFSRPLFSSKLGIHGDRARQPDSPTA